MLIDNAIKLWLLALPANHKQRQKTSIDNVAKAIL